jgi:NTP pyrophosphatase (non-canonical NTP hydrolase)
MDYVDHNYCAVAINEEAGEIAGWHKKYHLRGNPTGKLGLDDLKSELGDVLFYLTAMSSLYGWTLEEVMEFNKVKLDDRVARKQRSIA